MTGTPLMTLRFELPWPPSVNTYWRHAVVGGKWKKARAMVFLSKQAKDYRVEVLAEIAAAKVPRGAVRGRLGIHVVAHPPSTGDHDLDNLWKGMLDALKHAGVIRDDADFDDEHIVRGAPVKGGRLRITLTELGEFNEQAALGLAFAAEPQASIVNGALNRIDRDPF
jgi:crossover junction endodeoxyribonuclease RusA